MTYPTTCPLGSRGGVQDTIRWCEPVSLTKKLPATPGAENQ